MNRALTYTLIAFILLVLVSPDAMAAPMKRRVFEKKPTAQKSHREITRLLLAEIALQQREAQDPDGMMPHPGTRRPADHMDLHQILKERGIEIKTIKDLSAGLK